MAEFNFFFITNFSVFAFNWISLSFTNLFSLLSSSSKGIPSIKTTVNSGHPSFVYIFINIMIFFCFE